MQGNAIPANVGGLKQQHLLTATISVQEHTTLNKADLVARVSEATGLPKATTEVAVNTIFTAVTDGLAKGDSIAIAGFGTFTVKNREARKGRNPRTGDEIDIPASNVPGFKAGKALKDAVN